MKDKKVELQIKIIESFLEDEELAYNYNYFIRKTGATKEEIKEIMTQLRRSGMVDYVRGLMTENGEVAGSGFELSTRATQWSVKEWLEELKKI